MAQLRVGLIGVGRMGIIHGRNLLGKITGARLTAIADVDQERLEAVAQDFGGVQTYLDYRELIRDSQVDAIVIAGPTDQREEMLIESFETSKPIFCEKPLSLSMDGVQKIKEAANKHNPFLQIGFMRRFDPGYASARQMIEEGRIGRPVAVRSMSLDPQLAPYEYIAASGGIFADLAIHDFDIVRFLMNDEVRTVYSVGGIYKYDRLVEYDDVDNALCTLQFAGGSIGTVHGSRHATYGYDVQAEVYGTEGTVRIGYDRHTPVLLLAEGRASHDYVPFFAERFDSAYYLEMQAFVNAVKGGQPSPVGLEAGERALAIAIAAKESLKQGAPVDVQL